MSVTPQPTLKTKRYPVTFIRGDNMDTLFAAKNNYNEKLIETVVNFSIIGVLIFSQSIIFNSPLFADDLRMAKAALVPIGINGQEIKEKVLNELSPEVRESNFNKNIKRKYPNALIKTVDKGIAHIKLTKYYDGRPVKINILEVDLKLADNFEARPALSSQTNNLNSRRTITTIARNTNSIAALNGTYFKPQTGVPLGILMIDGKLYTGPIYDRVAMGFFDNGFDMARVQLNSYLKGSQSSVKVDNINQPRMLSSYVLAYSNDWGTTSPATPKYGIQIAIKDNKIIASSYSPLIIPKDGYVIVGPEKQLKPLLKDNKAELIINTSPAWKGVNHIISGGPYLVKNSEIFVDMSVQKLGAIGGKNPRSAIGYTQENNLIMVAVDGREGSSVGMTLMQLAKFMKSLGCINAMNLDGGGSTVMYVDGVVVNNPQVKGGISISNALVLAKKD